MNITIIVNLFQEKIFIKILPSTNSLYYITFLYII